MTAKEIAEKAAALGGWEVLEPTKHIRKWTMVVYGLDYVCPVEALKLWREPDLSAARGAVIRAADNSPRHDPELRRILLTGVTK